MARGACRKRDCLTGFDHKHRAFVRVLLNLDRRASQGGHVRDNGERRHDSSRVPNYLQMKRKAVSVQVG
jgi:hypothetical protein